MYVYIYEDRPFVAGPISQTSGIFEILHRVMETALSLIPHIV